MGEPRQGLDAHLDVRRGQAGARPGWFGASTTDAGAAPRQATGSATLTCPDRLPCTAICRKRHTERLSMSSSRASARLEARISVELHATIKRAADLQDRTVTDFVISAVQDAARRAIREAEVIALSLDDQRRFSDALLSPPRMNAGLRRAFARRRKLISPR